MSLPIVFLPAFKKNLPKIDQKHQQEALVLIQYISDNDGGLPENLDTGKKSIKIGREVVKLVICKPNNNFRLTYCVHAGKLVAVHVSTRENYYDKQKLALSSLKSSLDRL